MNEYNRHSYILKLSPSQVRFTQDSIAMCFQNEVDINETCEEIVKGNIEVQSFPLIRVLIKDGFYFSVDNRRLYVFRVLNVLGRLNYIEVKQWKEHNREITTDNLGCHVTVRNRKIDNRWKFGETYKHCSCVDGRNHKLPKWWNEKQKCHISQVRVRLPNPTENTKHFPYTFTPRIKTNTEEKHANTLQHSNINRNKKLTSQFPNNPTPKNTSSRQSNYFDNHNVDFLPTSSVNDFSSNKPNHHQKINRKFTGIVNPSSVSLDQPTNAQPVNSASRNTLVSNNVEDESLDGCSLCCSNILKCFGQVLCCFDSE